MSQRLRPRKPWFHAPSGFWCAQITGKRHYLDRDPIAAQRKLNRLLQEQQRGDAAHRQWLDAHLADLADEFLDDIKARRHPDTYRSYREMLELAQKHLGTSLRVGEVRKLHLTRLEQALHANYSPTTVFKALQSLQRVFNWAVENDLLAPAPRPARPVRAGPQRGMLARRLPLSRAGPQEGRRGLSRHHSALRPPAACCSALQMVQCWSGAAAAPDRTWQPKGTRL
jgi:hypothetical protein